MCDENEKKIWELERRLTELTHELSESKRLFNNANRNHGKWKNRALTAEADVKSLLENSVKTRRLMLIDDYDYMIESSYNEDRLPDQEILDDFIYFWIDTIELETKMTTRDI